jgi:hypothetical protein
VAHLVAIGLGIPGSIAIGRYFSKKGKARGVAARTVSVTPGD